MLNTAPLVGVLALSLTLSLPVTMIRLISDDAGSTRQSATQRSNDTNLNPRGFAPRTPLHALSRAASTARSDRVARSHGSLASWSERQVYETASTARIRGRVFAADTGKPLAGAIVGQSSTRAPRIRPQRQGKWIRTDADGRWEALDLPAGGYTLSVSKAGYLKIEYGQKRPFERGKTLDVAPGQLLDRIDITLPRSGAITGRVFDEFGDPAAAVFVRALRQRYVNGRRELTPLAEALEGLANGGGDLTDDLGQFRIYGLAPGDYFVSAWFSPPGEAATALGYPPIYYPGTPSAAEARRIRIGLGEETQNIDLTLVSARYAIVAGTVLNSLNSPASASIQLVTADPVAGVPVAPTRATSNGTFTLRSVPPGDYRLNVYDVRPVPGAPEFASIPVSVSGEDMTAFTIGTAPGAIATGRVVLEDGAKAGCFPVRSQRHTIANAPTFSNLSVGVNPDLTFEISGLAGRQTFRTGTLPDGWFLKSVTHEGVDITDTGYDFRPGQRVSGIEIRLTRRAATVSGMVQDSAGAAVGDYTVVVFSTTPANGDTRPDSSAARGRTRDGNSPFGRCRLTSTRCCARIRRDGSGVRP